MVAPYYQDDQVTLYHGDCLDVLPQLTERVNLCITDPPYAVRLDEWDNMEEHEFARFCMRWIPLVEQMSDGLISFGTDSGTLERLLGMAYPSVRKALWHKPAGSQYAGSSEKKLWFTYESIFVCDDGETWSVVTPKKNEVGRLIREAREKIRLSRSGVDIQIRGKKTGLCFRWEEGACLPTPEQVSGLKKIMELNGDFDEALREALQHKSKTMTAAREKAAEKADVFIHRTVTGGLHPCEKPLPLMKELVELYSEREQIILDPFAGSGATLVAAKLLKRKAIGIEQDERYCELMVNERLNRPIPLFAATFT